MPVVTYSTYGTSDIVPTNPDAQDLGSTSNPWKSLLIQTSMVLVETTANYTLTWADPSAARALTIPDPGADANVVLDQGTYTIAGAWTFSAVVTFSAVPVFNAASITLAHAGGANIAATDSAGMIGIVIKGARTAQFANNGDLVMTANALLATTATAGFLVIPSVNGTPTGTPATYNGTALCFNPNLNVLWAYSTVSAKWVGVQLA